MNKEFEDIMYASEKRMKSLTKFLVYDSKGTLRFSDKKISFTSDDHDIDINPEDIQNISKTRPSFAWIFNLLIWIPVLVYAIWSSGLIATIFALIIVGGFQFWIASRDNFVRIEYIDDGERKTANFAHFSAFGYKKPEDIYGSFLQLTPKDVSRNK